MKIKEFVDHILKHMDAREALEKLMATQLSHYEKLKLEKQPEDNPEQISPYFILVAAALDLGWGIAIEKGDKKDIVRGMVVGTDDYMNHIFKKEDDANNNEGQGGVVSGETS